MSLHDDAINNAINSGVVIVDQQQRIVDHYQALNPNLFPFQTHSGQPLLHDIIVSPVAMPVKLRVLFFITDVTMAVHRERYLREQQNARDDALLGNARFETSNKALKPIEARYRDVPPVNMCDWWREISTNGINHLL